MTRYILYGSKKHVICQVAKKLLEALSCALCQTAKKLMEKAKLDYIYVDVGLAEGLASYHYEIATCDGSKLPGLLVAEIRTGDNESYVEEKLHQGMAAIDYLNAQV